MVKVFLKKGKEEPVRRKHPWVFSGAIARIEGQAEDGEIATVFDFKGNFLGTGHFHHGSIAVRIVNFEETDIAQQAFWDERLRQALAVRQWCALPYPGTTDAYRLLHGEGDGLSGLIVDIYGDTAVVQCHSIGMHLQKDLITTALKTVLSDTLTGIYDKSAEALPPKYAAGQENGWLWQKEKEDKTTGIVLENGVKFQIDWVTGQKTGFFLDQRDNRQLLTEFAPGKKVLNTFCYTGGFSCYALKAGAAQVVSVDVSAKAMELTDRNIALNAPYTGEHESVTADVMAYLRDNEKMYDIIIVDPPAFAKSLDKRHNAVQGYKRLNVSALRSVAPNGIVFTFSCSQVIDRELFYNTIAAAAIEAGRNIRVLKHLTQGSDHPVSMFHPEGAYLKGLVLHVE